MARLKLNERTVLAAAQPTRGAQAYYWDTELPGFGLVVGATGHRAFIARGRVNGGLVKRTIGALGAPGVDGLPWTAQLARIAARKILGGMTEGATPRTKRRARGGVAAAPAPSGALTLADAFERHLARMRADEATPASLATITRERDKYLASWLTRELASITRDDCRALHGKLTSDHGPYVANRVLRHVRAAWNTTARAIDLPTNPTIAVDWNKEHRRQEPIAWDKLHAWYTTVIALEDRGHGQRGPGVRGDYQLFVLLTGLRRMDAATVRWEHLDLEDAVLHRPNPKGGKERAFTVPLSTACVELLERRRLENLEIHTGGDRGWVFPTVAIKAKACALCAALGLKGHEAGAVIHLVEGKQQRINSEGRAERILPSPHRLRDTYTSALVAVGGVSPYVIDVLTNHRPPRGSVTAGYIDVGLEQLAEHQERVSQWLMERCAKPPAKKRARLRAV